MTNKDVKLFMEQMMGSLGYNDQDIRAIKKLNHFSKEFKSIFKRCKKIEKKFGWKIKFNHDDTDGWLNLIINGKDVTSFVNY